ncbi:MAG: hypothetical protein WAW42_20315, partial [Candidatus Competibacteraceae bacterium]
AEATRAEAARRKAQAESTQTARTTPVRSSPALPTLELVSRSETRPSPPAPPPRQPTLANPASHGAVAGSYAIQENAFAVRDQYRSRNIRAEVERVMVSGRPMYQVRIWR